jgi:hypothetical protein
MPAGGVLSHLGVMWDFWGAINNVNGDAIYAAWRSRMQKVGIRHGLCSHSGR